MLFLHSIFYTSLLLGKPKKERLTFSLSLPLSSFFSQKGGVENQAQCRKNIIVLQNTAYNSNVAIFSFFLHILFIKQNDTLTVISNAKQLKRKLLNLCIINKISQTEIDDQIYSISLCFGTTDGQIYASISSYFQFFIFFFSLALLARTEMPENKDCLNHSASYQVSIPQYINTQLRLSCLTIVFLTSLI